MNADRFGKSKAVGLPAKHAGGLGAIARHMESLERRVLLSATLTHEYPFTFGTMADNVGAAPGSVAGGAAFNNTGTGAGYGLELPGTGTQGVNQNYASIPASDLSGLTSGTIEGWFTVGTQETSSKVFMAGQGTSSYIAVTASNGSSGEAQLEFKAAGSSEVDTASTSYALTPGTEYYFAAVVDASAETMSLYVGTGGSESLVGSVSLATANAGSPANLSSINFAAAYLGGSLANNQDFNGSIQDVRIYNGALTSAQVAADATAGPNATLTNTDPFGVASSAQALGDYSTFLPTLASAGVAWSRAAAEPASPSQGVWDWSAADTYNATVKADGFYQTGMLNYVLPSWLQASDPNGLDYVNTPAELSWYSSYVTESVTHLKGQVEQWEIGNEANLSGMSAANYAEIVETAYNAAKAADPNAQIGMSVASVDVNWLQQVIQDGAANHFDFIIVHPYEIAATITDGEEADFSHIVPTIHTMLASADPSEANAPVWVTEVGIYATPGNMPQLVTQAQNLWQIYTMGIAQGFAHIDWFDAQADDPYGQGLLDASGDPNPAYYALAALTGQLGTDPQYLGWVMLNGVDYGFVFQGASGIVMATWAPPSDANTVNFGQSVEVESVDPSTGNIDSVTASTYDLGAETPILVSGLSSSNSIVTTAEANLNQPLPWNGNHANSTSVSVTMGSTNTENGVHQLDGTTSSSAATFDGTAARFAGVSASQTFTVDPSFLAYTSTPIEVSVVVGSAPGADAGFSFIYESTDPSKFSSIGWNYIPGDGTWHTITFTISNEQFDSIWGYNFGFNSDSTSNSQYYIQSVTVTKIPAAPTDLTATTASSSQIDLAWSAVAGATSYDIYRGTTAGDESATPIATGVTGTSYTDTLLDSSTKYYYTVEAVDDAVNSVASNEASATTRIVPGVPAQLTGTPSANTPDSYADDGYTYLDVFDGNPNTYFDSPYSDGNWVQLDLGAAATITSIAFVPRYGWSSRMVGGIFEASNDPTFTTGVVTLYTVTSSPAFATNTVPVSLSADYQYVRYVSPAGGYGNIAEMQVFGYPGASAPETTIAAWNFPIESPSYNSPTATSDYAGANNYEGTGTGGATLQTIGFAPGGDNAAYGDVNDTADDDVVSTASTAVAGFSENTWSIQNTASDSDTDQGWDSRAPDDSQGAELDLDTTGYANVYLSFDWYTSVSGIRDLQEEYNLDATNPNSAGTWVPLGSPLVAVAGDYYGANSQSGTTHVPVTLDLTGVTTGGVNGTGASNDPYLGIRLVSAYDPLVLNASGQPYEYTSAAWNGTGTAIAYNDSSGDWRFGNITVNANPDWLTPASAYFANWNPANNTLTITGSAVIDADPGSNIAISPTAEPNIVDSTAGSTVSVTPPTSSPIDIHIGGVDLSGGADIVVTSFAASRTYQNHSVLVVGAENATTSPIFSVGTGSKLDLTDNDMIVHDGNLAAVQALAQEGRDAPDGPGNGFDGTWAGNGLTSSAAAAADTAAGFEQNVLAVVQNADMPFGSFPSWTVGSAIEPLRADGDDIIVKYTYDGDTNLEGYVGNDAATTIGFFYDDNNTLVADGNKDEWCYGDLDGSGYCNDNDAGTLGFTFGDGGDGTTHTGNGLPQL